MIKMKLITKNPQALILGILLGALVVLAARFVTYKPAGVHYHANFAVFINGQKEDFKADSYYEEETACKEHVKMQPVDRAHMHEHVNNVVHVHDNAVTWGQFFENIGWGIGKNYISTPAGTFLDNSENKLHIILDGENMTGISAITNTVIKDQSTLLLNYGREPDKKMQEQFKAIPNDAKEHDEEDDPATCSGGTETPSMSDRFKHMF